MASCGMVISGASCTRVRRAAPLPEIAKSLSHKQRRRNFFKAISILYTVNRDYLSVNG
jgi:hypothetical protein